MRKITILIFTLLSIFIAGCATTYHPVSFTGGYFNQQIESDVIRIGFSGNGYTSGIDVEDYIVFRCAEVTNQLGYQYFTYLDVRDYTSSSQHSTPLRTKTSGSATVSGNTIYGSATSTTTGGQNYTITKPAGTVTIKLFKTKPQGLNVRDANQVIRYLSPKIDFSKKRNRRNKIFWYVIVPATIASNAYQWPEFLY